MYQNLPQDIWWSTIVVVQNTLRLGRNLLLLLASVKHRWTYVCNSYNPKFCQWKFHRWPQPSSLRPLSFWCIIHEANYPCPHYNYYMYYWLVKTISMGIKRVQSKLTFTKEFSNWLHMCIQSCILQLDICSLAVSVLGSYCIQFALMPPVFKALIMKRDLSGTNNEIYV